MKLQPKQILRRWFTGSAAIPNESFRRWHMVLSAIFAVQAVAILLFGAAHNVPIMAAYLIKDTLQSQLTHQTVLAPAVRQLFMLNIAYVLAVLLFVMAVFHALSATVLRANYEAGLKQRSIRIRWIVYGMALALMMAATALAAGVYNLDALLALLAFGLLAGVTGLVGEALGAQPAKRDGQLRSAVCAAAIVAAVLPLVMIVLFAVATGLYGNSTVSALVYGMLATVYVWIAAVAGNMYLVRKKIGKWATYGYGERWYLILAVVLQSLLAWEVFVAVLRP
ncbi:MAG TPA: heliorhodopsin HeR [Candidatus Saccharimonadales bacterium]|nr:heliorhodopsin HeR [Candidatus Saccharimonadales bacterium]